MRKPVHFPLGQIVATPGALDAIVEAKANATELLRRHARGDWGDVCAEDKRANDRSVGDGTRILSAYILPDKTKVWVITEADRSATTFLLPSEY